MTDKEIIKGLECCLTEIKIPFEDELPCKECPYAQKPCRQLMKDAHNLIKQQQTQLDNYSHNVRNLTTDFIEQQRVIYRQQAEIERLTTIAKKMHSWIFTNSYDEEKAYAECGLTDEENALLGYCGKIVFESKEMVGEGK